MVVVFSSNFAYLWYYINGDNMELKDAILDRRSIRKYKSDIVREDILLEGIKMGVKAPSAHNRQPWKFKLLSKEEKDKVASLLEDKTKDIPLHSGPHTASVIREVPHLIMIFLDSSESDDREMDILSVGACIENMILYYTSMGLGTIWIGNTNIINEEIKDLLGINYDTISSLGIGFKNQEPHSRPRKEFEDVIL